MKLNQKGYSVIEIVLVLVIVGLIGTVGWLVYDRQNNKAENNETTNARQAEDDETTSAQQVEDDDSRETTKESDYKTHDGIKYTVPTDWVGAKGPFKDSEIEVGGQYLLSPDYEEAGGGQLFIEAGAYINFQKLEWAGIDKNTSVEQAASVVKNGEGGYLDSDSVEVSKVGDVQVVMFDAGHTTDGVTVFYKTSNGQWLDASFSTTTGGDGNYNAQDSPHYKTFLAWLELFTELNS